MATETMAVETMPAETIINYFDISNDRVFYPGTAGYQRRKFDTKPVTINDLRGQEQDFTLDKNGFQVLKAHWSEHDVEDTPSISRVLSSQRQSRGSSKRTDYCKACDMARMLM